MNNSSHRIEIFEPYEYNGPNPLLLSFSGSLITPDKKPAVLLTAIETINIDDQDFSQVVVRPKHLDPIERVTESNCTVIISLVRPHSLMADGDQYQYADVMNWGVGKIKLLGGAG